MLSELFISSLVSAAFIASLTDCFDEDARDSVDKAGDADADDIEGCGDELDDTEMDSSFLEPPLLTLATLGVDSELFV